MRGQAAAHVLAVRHLDVHRVVRQKLVVPPVTFVVDELRREPEVLGPLRPALLVAELPALPEWIGREEPEHVDIGGAAQRQRGRQRHAQRQRRRRRRLTLTPPRRAHPQQQPRAALSSSRGRPYTPRPAALSADQLLSGTRGEGAALQAAGFARVGQRNEGGQCGE